MRISELLLWLLNQYIVIDLLCPQRAALLESYQGTSTTGKLNGTSGTNCNQRWR